MADLDKVREIAQRVADSSGLELVDVDLRGGGKARMLRIFIDKPEGVTHEDCSNFSREVGTIFDVEDAVPGGAYTLEVSSPGLDRKLLKPADWIRFQGTQGDSWAFKRIGNGGKMESAIEYNTLLSAIIFSPFFYI